MARADQTGHCSLCDLPRAQCAHGYEARQKRKDAKAKRKKAVKDETRRAQAPLDRARGKPGARSTVCVKCNSKQRYGRYRYCVACGISEGFRVCKGCGRYFMPETGASRKAKCKTCKRKVGSSAFVVASAGLPSLGRRN